MATRDLLLTFLREKKESWISGESLSTRIGVSRSAVWKHIHSLKKEGYIIESSPKKGYLFQGASDLLLPGEIQDGLDTKILGKGDIVHFEETDSTNLRAKDLAAKGAPEGTLVISEGQTEGKGRRGREWFSPPRAGIYATMILRPGIPPGEAPKIALLSAVAVAETLLSITKLDAKIKWPNDILIGGKKIAGILTELSTEMDEVNYILVGLGLNVNTPRFPNDIRNIATSIFVETGKRFHRVGIIKEYLKWYEQYYWVFKKTGFAPIRNRWKELTNMIGQEIVIETIVDKQTGIVQGIDENGYLIVKDKNGISHNVFSGEVAII